MLTVAIDFCGCWLSWDLAVSSHTWLLLKLLILYPTPRTLTSAWISSRVCSFQPSPSAIRIRTGRAFSHVHVKFAVNNMFLVLQYKTLTLFKRRRNGRMCSCTGVQLHWFTTVLHCVSEKWGTHIMPDNSRKCEPISIILLLSHTRWTAENDWIRCVISPQICCRTTVQNLIVQLCYFTARYSMQMWNRIIYLQYLSTRYAKLCFLCLRRLINNYTTCAKIVCPQHTHMLWSLRHARQWRHQSIDASVTRCLMLGCKMFSKIFQWCWATLAAPKIHNNKLKINLLNINTFQFNKLDVYIVLVNMSEQLYSWTFNFLEVVHWRILGEVVDLIPSFCSSSRNTKVKNILKLVNTCESYEL